MTGHRFRDPQGNEWVTIETPSEEMLSGYPMGTIEIDMVPITTYPESNFPKRPNTIALSKLSITDGVIEGFTVDSALSGGVQIYTGKFMMFFAAPQPDINYIVNVFDGGLFRCYVQPEDYAEDYFTVTTTTLSGEPSDPACLSIIIMRAE